MTATTPLADLSGLPPIAQQRGGDPDLLFCELKHIIATAIDAHPRSQQKRLGPSEIGDPCARRLAYKLTDTPQARKLSTPWRPTVGTAVHSWLEEAFAQWNQDNHEDNGASRFLLETRIDAGDMAGGTLAGSSDIYDRVTATAMDWKIIGPSAHKRLRADINAGRGPRREYQVQLHTYGLGYIRRGLPVDRVMLIALPAAGELDDALMWSAPYDESIAVAAMARIDRIHALLATLGAPTALGITNAALTAAGVATLADPDGQPADPAIGIDGHGCRFCPWLAPATDSIAAGCPGVVHEADPPQNLRDLIA